MFSGIIESLGTIREFVHGQESAAMVVETKTNFSSLEEGESIAVNGVCLTVVDFNESMSVSYTHLRAHGPERSRMPSSA